MWDRLLMDPCGREPYVFVVFQFISCIPTFLLAFTGDNNDDGRRHLLQSSKTQHPADQQ